MLGTTSANYLIVAIDGNDRRPYWDSWVVALDAFLAECGLLTCF